MKRVCMVFTLVFTMMLLHGCQSDIQKDMGTEGIGIRGYVTEISSNKKSGTIRVEGEIEPDTSYDQAVIQIDRNTSILKNQSTRLYPVSEIKKGDRVEVIFKGAVAKSYPVQAVGKIVRIINNPLKK